MLGIASVQNELTARDLMTMNPVSINEHLALREAASVLTNRGISAAPVIDDAGRPVGVLSRTDILRHMSDDLGPRSAMTEFYDVVDPSLGETAKECVEHTQVWQAMTPVVLSVNARASVAEMIEELVRRKVHRLFVIDDDGTLIGVVTALDILRGLTR